MSEPPAVTATDEPERDQQLAEALSIQRAKLAATRTIQASQVPTRPDGTRPASNASSGWVRIGSVRWEERFAPLIARAKAEREERIRAFLSAGGRCIDCFDQGECRYCDRGQAQIERRRLSEIRALVERSGLPPRFLRHTFASYPGRKPVVAGMEAYVAGWDGRQNLILLGRYGVGKTGLFAGAINALAEQFHERGQRIVFTTTPALFDRLRAGYDDGTFQRTLSHCQQANLLILDDLGAERGSEWVLERLYAIVNHRYERELPTWISSNLTPDGITGAIGERVWYRLKEGARVLEITGPNLREQQA